MIKDLKNIKVFFVDLDGTLIDERREQISPTNLQAIHNLQKNGIVILSTGRMGKSLFKYMKLTKVPYAVAANGAQIIDRNGNILRSKTLNDKTIQYILAFAKKNKLTFKVNDEKKAYGARSLLSRLVCKILHYKIVKNTDNNFRGLYKIVLWGKSRFKIKHLINSLKKSNLDTSIVSSEHGFTIEITNCEATKGLGNQFVWKNLLEIHNIQETAHIGDSMNDSTVIGFVGTFIAMKNAPKQLIKLADYLGPHYRRGGFAKMINGYNDYQLKKLKN